MFYKKCFSNFSGPDVCVQIYIYNQLRAVTFFDCEVDFTKLQMLNIYSASGYPLQPFWDDLGVDFACYDWLEYSYQQPKKFKKK